MKKLKVILAPLSLIIMLSCSSVDYSNPEEVLKNYRLLSWENRNDVLYDDYLSTKSKGYVTKDEFIKTRNIPDNVLNSSQIIDSKISLLPIDINNPSFRRLKVEEKTIKLFDTVYVKLYYTLNNEDGQWKVIWIGSLYSFALEKFNKGNYLESRKTLEKIIELHPFDGSVYSLLAWCYIRDKTLLRNERENGIVKNAKYAISLEEDVHEHYNTLSSYYSLRGDPNLAIQTLERGLEFCKNESELEIFYSNLSSNYLSVSNYEKAEEYIKRSIGINDNDGFAWYTYGNIMRSQNKIAKAILHYETALKKDNMENSLQGELYFAYAYCCFKALNYETAKEYSAKALDMEPDNVDYLSLYKTVRSINR